MKKILVILSSVNQLPLSNGKTQPTGFYLNEFGIPAQRLREEGYELVLANPKGNQPPMDQSSDDASFFHKDENQHRQIKNLVTQLPGFAAPKTFGEILAEGLDQFAGVFVPGGHAPMVDLIQDRQLGQILHHFHDHAKPTALICHGPAALLSAQADPEIFVERMAKHDPTEASDWPYAGYKMTVFSNIEEKMAELTFPAALQFYAETALKQAGASMDCALIPMQSHVVKHNELVTGQNPVSDDALASAFLSMLALSQQPR
jgi:putative intracellular protease/amidase